MKTATRSCCRYCTSYVEAYRWAARLYHARGGEIVTLGYVCVRSTGLYDAKRKGRAPFGFECRDDQQTLETMVQRQRTAKIAGRYLLRDACPGLLPAWFT